MTTEDAYRLRARRAINAARRGHLPKPKASLFSQPTISSLGEPSSSLSSSSPSPSTPRSSNHVFETARENSIEVYDDKFGRNSILTRSARMRKFKFYQYEPVKETTNGKSSHNQSISDSPSPRAPGPVVLVPREDVLHGKTALIAGQSKEISDLDDQIVVLEKKIANLTKNSGNKNDVDSLDEIFYLVNKKNDLLRRQMQLNILEQEKRLEKANEELTKELRSLMSIEDSRKTPAELERQKYLYEQSLALVNKRNELVLHMDVQERGIEDDNEMKAKLKTVFSEPSTRNRFNKQDQNCCIQ